MTPPVLKRLLGLVFLCAIVLISGLGVFAGADNIRQAEAQLETVLQTNLELDKENRAMYRVVQQFKQSRAAMERLCRMELGMVRADEIIYQLP